LHFWEPHTVSSQGFRERILEVAEDGTALASSTSQTSILPAIRKTAALPVGYFDRIGRVLSFCFSGRISTVVTTPGTLALAFRLGSVDVFSSGLMTLNIVAQTNVNWTFEGELICRAIGASTSTTLFPKGCKFSSHAVIGSPAPTAGGGGVHMLPYNAAPAVGTGFDNGVAQLVDLLATWSVSNAANSIQLHCGHVDLYS
jgi:hypothetical protein